jgi:hypothetical protein
MSRALRVVVDSSTNTTRIRAAREAREPEALRGRTNPRGRRTSRLGRSQAPSWRPDLSSVRRLLGVALLMGLLLPGGVASAAASEAADLAQDSSGPPDAGFGQRGAHCGSSLALDGDRLLVGCPDYDAPVGADTGAAFVFVRRGAAWVLEARLLASDAAPTPSPPGSILLPDAFGISVSLSGDTAVVGSLFDDHAGGRDAGAAYVFVRTGSTWAEQQKLVASDAANNDRFGVSVSVSGGTVVVGSFNADHAGGENAGAAYVFVRNGAKWRQQQKLTAPDAAAGDNFGVAVAVSGDTALVGARHDGVEAAGSAHVFVRSGDKWRAQQKLEAADAAPGDEFGAAVALASDTAVIGAAGSDTGRQESAGAAYAFVRKGTRWTQQQKLVASDPAVGDSFGHEVAVAGDTALVGALNAGDALATDAGAAYVFVRNGSRWVEQRKLMGADAVAEDRFGAGVALSGDVAAAAAFLDDHDGIDAGSTYVFARTGAEWSQQQKIVASSAPVGPRPAIRAADRDAVKETMAVLRGVGTAMMEWMIAETAKPGWRSQPGKVVPAGVNWSQCPAISYDELRPLLAPFVEVELPREDSWGHSLEFCLDRDTGLSFAAGARSPGRDGRFTGSDYARLGKYDPLDVDGDIVWMDGLFVVWPQN